MQTVVETAEFLRRAKECGVTEGERAQIVNFIAANAMAGDEIKGAGAHERSASPVPEEGKAVATASSPSTAVWIFRSFCSPCSPRMRKRI